MRALLLSAVLSCACGDTTIFDPMERQPKYKPFAANPIFEDGRAMRAPPPGTVPRERQTMRPEVARGKDKYGQPVTDIPVAVTHELMDLGRKQYEIRCAVCHGLVGDGYSPVATKMALRPPPSLLELHNVGAGHLFQVITEGYGLMPSYAVDLEARERWAVIAYLWALRKSQAVALADAPPDIQKKLREEPAR